MLTPSAVPQILTPSTVSLLSDGLDAGDILECYALVRRATLRNNQMTDATLTIHKVALGLRYRPLTELDESVEKIREITLEYGPQRMGANMDQESMPSVHREQTTGGDTVDVNNTSSKAFVTWENEGKIYYTTQIASTGYVSAYYMASVTGAVLGKILEKAVEYPMENAKVRGRMRRYQPFVVVDGNAELPPGYEGEAIPTPSKRKVMLRSSSSVDFMEYMWYTLAELGVGLHPILAPPTYEVQLFTSGIEKVKVGPPNFAIQSAAKFYDTLYQCIEAKVTGDYSGFAKPPTPSPTASSPAPSTSDQLNDFLPGASTNSTESSDIVEPGENDNGRFLRADFPGTPEVMETDPPIDPLKDIENLLLDDDNATVTNATTFSDMTSNNTKSSTSQDEKQAPNTAALEVNKNTTQHNTTIPSSEPPSSPPTNDAPSDAPSMMPTVHKANKQDTKSEVDEAQAAADQAKQAAAEAKDAAKTDVDSKAADAAQAAAKAAQKAADATSSAAAQAAMDALLSGDGSAMTSVISPCLIDPQFGIAVQGENGTVISQVYLYLDGSSYYRVNLTFPFVQIVPVEHTLPQPRDFAVSGSGGDFVDWTLAIGLLFLFIFGMLMLIQQLMGGYVKLIRPLYNFQMWFFNPLHHEDMRDNFEEERRLTEAQGGGQPYNFGQDVIPVSMGGRKSNLVRIGLGLQHNHGGKDDENNRIERTPLTGNGEHEQVFEPYHDHPEIEMTEARAVPRNAFDGPHRSSASSVASSGSIDHDDLGGNLNGHERPPHP
jgi:hypothetical protein